MFPCTELHSNSSPSLLLGETAGFLHNIETEILNLMKSTYVINYILINHNKDKSNTQMHLGGSSSTNTKPDTVNETVILVRSSYVSCNWLTYPFEKFIHVAFRRHLVYIILDHFTEAKRYII